MSLCLKARTPREMRQRERERERQKRALIDSITCPPSDKVKKRTTKKTNESNKKEGPFCSSREESESEKCEREKKRRFLSLKSTRKRFLKSNAF